MEGHTESGMMTIMIGAQLAILFHFVLSRAEYLSCCMLKVDDDDDDDDDGQVSNESARVQKGSLGGGRGANPLSRW